MTATQARKALEKLVRFYTWGAASLFVGLIIVMLFGVTGVMSWRLAAPLLSLFVLVIGLNLWGRQRFKRVLDRARE